MWFSRRSRSDARPVGLRHQGPQCRPVVDPGHGGEQPLHDLGVGIHQPGGDLGGEDALQHQQAEGLVAGMAALAPAEEIVLHPIGGCPVGEGLEQGAPGGPALAVRHRQVRDRLADVVTQPGESCRQAPARLQLPALGGAAVQGEDPPLARLGGVEGDLQPVAEEAPRPAVVVRLGGREQVDEGGVALHHGPHQGGEARVGEGQTVLQPGDQLRLGGDDARRRGDRQALEERRVAGDLGVVGGRVRGSAESGRAWWLAALEEFHAAMLHRLTAAHRAKTSVKSAPFHGVAPTGGTETLGGSHKRSIDSISFC